MTIEELKDVFYITGSILGIIGFIRTLKKRDFCELNYKTEFGDEVKPFLFCIRGDIFNLEIASRDKSVFAKKLPFDTILNKVKYSKIDEDLNMPKVYLEYEDKYHNKYRQTFEFELSDITRESHLQHQSRNFYNISKRYFRLFWIWSSLKTYNWRK